MAEQKPLRIGTTVPIQQFEATDTIPPGNVINGVPAGGTTGQVLAKIDGTDYNTEWVDQTGGGGGDGNGIYDGSGAIPDATHAKLAGEFTTFFLDYNNDAPAFSIDPDAVGGVSIYDPSSANYFTITSGGITFTGPAGGLSIDQIGFVMSSTIAAFYAPKMTTTQRDAISGVASPTEGAIIYNLTIHKLQVYDGTTWQSAW